MSDTPPPSTPPPAGPTITVPAHWTPEQALAVAECLQAMRHALWVAYGPRVQQAWRDQLMPGGLSPELDPDEPF
jgi:hypothetical protein